MERLREMLLYCSLINLGFLALWGLLFLLAQEWLYGLNVRLCRLSREQFAAINVAGISFYEIAILLFNLAPYVALRIMG